MHFSRYLRIGGWLIGLVIGAAATTPAAAVREHEVTANVETVAATDAAVVQTRVRLTPGPQGSQFLTVTVTNASAREVRLKELTVSFPWEPALGEGAQVSSGGASMFRTPTLVRADAAQAATSRAFVLTRREGGRGFGLAAFLTWKTFWSKLVFQDGRLTITVDGEGRRFRPGETLALEKLWLAEGDDWPDLLWAYGDLVAQESRRPVRPRADVGWSNWDYYGARFTAPQLRANLAALAALKVGANLFQIDGGWWSRCGDYLAPRADLPMRDLAQEVRQRGMTLGLHFDGARADRDARVVAEHPEYFLHDGNGELLVAKAGPTGKPGRVYFDFSHPGAREYWRHVLTTIRREWGCEYFKVDFLRLAFPEYQLETLAEPRGRRIVPHDEALTSLERFHLGMTAFREGMGDDAYFLACTAEFGPMFGHADGLRTGGDIDPTFSRFSRACMENGGNFYLHGKVVLNDADYHVARGRLDEDETLVKDPRKTGGDMPYALAEMWTHYAGLFGGPRISGDNLTILRDERKALFRRAVGLPACERYVPVDFWAHGRTRDDPFSTFLGEAQGAVYLAVFNWAETPRQARLSGLPASAIAGGEKLGGTAMVAARAGGVALDLPPRTSVVYRLEAKADFNRLRRALSVDWAQTTPNP